MRGLQPSTPLAILMVFLVGIAAILALSFAVASTKAKVLSELKSKAIATREVISGGAYIVGGHAYIYVKNSGGVTAVVETVKARVRCTTPYTMTVYDPDVGSYVNETHTYTSEFLISDGDFLIPPGRSVFIHVYITPHVINDIESSTDNPVYVNETDITCRISDVVVETSRDVYVLPSGMPKEMFAIAVMPQTLGHTITISTARGAFKVTPYEFIACAIHYDDNTPYPPKIYYVNGYYGVGDNNRTLYVDYSLPDRPGAYVAFRFESGNNSIAYCNFTLDNNDYVITNAFKPRVMLARGVVLFVEGAYEPYDIVYVSPATKYKPKPLDDYVSGIENATGTFRVQVVPWYAVDPWTWLLPEEAIRGSIDSGGFPSSAILVYQAIVGNVTSGDGSIGGFYPIPYPLYIVFGPPTLSGTVEWRDGSINLIWHRYV